MTMSKDNNAQDVNCIFCKIANGEDSATELLYQDDHFVAFRDIRPASTHHYLIVPRIHTPNINQLTPDHLTLVNSLVDIGYKVLREKGGDETDVRLGFHRPPFTSISHLHLHVISPPAHMGFLGKIIFRPDSWWFTTVETFKLSLAKA